MAQWGGTDNASNSVIWAPAQLKQAPNTTNRDLLFGNTTANGYGTGETISVRGVSAAEMAGQGFVKSITVTGPGANAHARPTVTVTDSEGSGTGATATAVAAAQSAAPNTAGASGIYGVGDVLEITGGTATTNSQFTVTGFALTDIEAVNASGSGYYVGSNFSVDGTGTAATANVTGVEVVTNATPNLGGSGYANNENVSLTVAGTSNADFVVTTDGSGAITVAAINTSARGAYVNTFVDATSSSNVGVSGGSGTGATLDVTFGVQAMTMLTGGVYTANLASLTAAATTSDDGSGATVLVDNVAVSTVSVSTPGDYTAMPTVDDAPTTLKTGTGVGAGCTLAVSFGVGETVNITDPGARYKNPVISFGGTGLVNAWGKVNLAEASGVAHSGWVLRKEGTGGRAGRVTYETLVAGGISGDASDDTLLPE